MKARQATNKTYYIQNNKRCGVIFDPGEISLLERIFDSIKLPNILIINRFCILVQELLKAPKVGQPA
jgi:hypothetical protein